MNTKSESKAKYWLYFLISLAATILLLIFMTPWFWLGLPPLLTSLVYAFDWV